jgi:hypothetical protein
MSNLFICYVCAVSNFKKRGIDRGWVLTMKTSKDEYELATYLFVMSTQSPIRKKNRQVMGSSTADYKTSKDE